MFKKTLLSICILALISGCSTHREIGRADLDVKDFAKPDKPDRNKVIGDASNIQNSDSFFLEVSELEKMFVPLEQNEKAQDLLPKIMIKERSFSQANAFDVLRDLLENTGISFTVSAETNNSSMVKSTISAIRINGYLPDLVEQLSKALGFYYSYNSKTKNLDVFLDKQYVAKVPPINELFESLPNMVKTLGGSAVFLDKSARNIAYRADRTTASRIENYLKEIRDNKVLLVYDTYIWEITLSDLNQTGINWNKLNTNLALNGNSGTLSLSGAGPSITNGIGVGMVFSDPGKTFEVDSLLTMLREQGTVKTVSQPRIDMLSGTSASFSNGETINYVSRVGSVAGGLGTSTTTTETSSVLSGVAINISGDFSNGTIYSEINVTMNDLLKFNNFNALGTTIQLPQTANREISTRVRVRDNDVIVLGGLIYDKSNYDEAGLPIGSSSIFANNVSDNRTRKELVVMLKPRVIKFGKLNGLTLNNTIGK
jgi:hypothetical protein